MGNFSKDPKDVLKEALKKDYESLLIQQGVPVLDRDLNLLSDLVHNWIQETNRKFIGNGVPAGSDGFKIDTIDFDTNNFTIKTGIILLNGHIFDLKPRDDGEPWTYKNQPIPDDGVRTEFKDFVSFNIFLLISQEEINADDDPSLANSEDVGIPTSVRRKTKWQVIVRQVGHVFLRGIATMLLARVERRISPLGFSPIIDKRVIDKRVKNLTLSQYARNIHIKDGNVGIGKTEPEAKLDIANVPTTSGGSPLGSDMWLRVGDGGDSGRVWVEYGQQAAPLLVLNDLDDRPRIQFQQIGKEDPEDPYTEENPKFASWIGHAKSKSSDIAIMGGNVGIGTTSPAQKLVIQKDRRPRIVLAEDGGDAGVLEFHESKQLRLQHWTEHGGKWEKSFMVLDANNGYVGIGTIEPEATLDVNGGAFLGYETTISDFGNVLKSGFYQNGGADIPGDVPDDSSPWSHLITARHSNRNNNHQLQIASSYRNNDRLFFRKIQHTKAESHNSTWHEVATRGPNEFSGHQRFLDGDIGIGTDSPGKIPGSTRYLSLVASERYIACKTAALEIQGSSNDFNIPIGKIDFNSVGPNYTTHNIARIEVKQSGNVSKGNFLFYTSDGDSLNEAVRIDESGNVGIGTPIPQYHLHTNGCSFAVSHAGGGIDYAEYFESLDGKKIPTGTSVVLDGDKIRPADKNETPIGIISSNSLIVGGVHTEWPKRYLRDEFGNLIMEEYEEEVMVPEKEKMTKERPKVEKKSITEEVTRTEISLENGKYIQKEISETITREVEEPLFEEVDLYDATGKNVIGKHEIPVTETYEEEIEVLDQNGQPVLVGSGEFLTKQRPKLNPDYDESKKYVSRENRPEWNCVGLLGQLPMRKGQPVAESWIKVKDISDDVELWLVK